MKHDWEYKKLGEVCEVYQPKTLSSSEMIEDGKYFVYGANGIIGKYDKYNHEESEVLLTCRGATCGTINVSEPFSWINGNAMVVHPEKDVICQSFLKYYLSSYDMSLVITGAAQPQITRQSLNPVPIPLPPLSTQQSIVSELDSLSKIIADCKETLKDYDALEQSIFYDMFGDPVKNDKGWEVKKLGDCCSELKYGTSRPACENGQYKYLRMGNLTLDGHLDLTDLKTIDIPDDEIDKCIVKYGDILFNRTNSMELIGKTCMFDLEEPMVIAGYIIRVRLLDTLNPRFLSIMFNLPSLKLRLKSMAKGAVNQANINSKELASIRVILPHLPLQQTFASKIEAIEQMKEEMKKALQEAETLFQARMDYWFN